MSSNRLSEEERFFNKVEKTDSCWNWIGSKVGLGYGGFRTRGKLWRAHRFVYVLLVGPIPDGFELDHLCRNRLCVNPEHLEPVTKQENVARGRAGWNHAAKTHCPQGHPYAGENLYLDHGRRRCLTCMREQGRIRARESYWRKKALK